MGGRRGRTRGGGEYAGGGSKTTQDSLEGTTGSVGVSVCVMVKGCVVQLDTRGV